LRNTFKKSISKKTTLLKITLLRKGFTQNNTFKNTFKNKPFEKRLYPK
jgi:hypothetical protein